MEYNKIGCSAGKTIVVDPNKFDGMNSSNNISVPLEDLSIYVQLETTKRARTLLQGDSSFNSSEFKVTFIEGEEVSGRKVLTTRYTDLTTSFDNNNSDNQSLGITSIDIDFNSSYAPLIVINFVDLRGSSVFQNESMLENGNKYSTLFQLPYPIFNLTIKGYYGLPVTYELHMTKFNAKFNSKTGNFEIVANFVGYTYAMLSDMLIGYLRAIAHTKIGSEKYKALKQANPYLLTLDELITSISTIDVKLKKLTSTDPVLINYNIYKEKLSQLDVFETNINLSASELGGKPNERNRYDFLNVTNIDIDKLNSQYVSYNDKTLENIKLFNDNNDKKFLQGELTTNNYLTFENLNIQMIKENNKDFRDILTNEGVQEDNIEKTRTSLLAFVDNNVSGNFTIVDLRPIYSQIDTKRNDLVETIKKYEISVGEKIKNEIATSLTTKDGELQPTIRNIVEIFTASVEVLMSVLYEVSEQAIKSLPRTEQLKKYTPSNNNPDGNRYDYKVSDITKNGNLDITYYPWPEYREDNEIYGLREAYLGTADRIDVPTDITEIEFINDLLNAFYTSIKIVDDTQIIEQKAQNTWTPVNPIDTELFKVKNYPYSRFNQLTTDDVLRVIMDRAAIYFGVTNKSLTNNEIIAFANAEADNLLIDIDPKIKLALSQLNFNTFVNVKANANGVSTKILEPLNVGGLDLYYYNYLFSGEPDGFKLLPISTPEISNFTFSVEKTQTKEFENSGNIFLTNYVGSSPFDTTEDYVGYINSGYWNNAASTAHINNYVKNSKPDDGGVYLKIFSKSEFDSLIKPLSSNIAKSENVLLLDDLILSETQFNTKVKNGQIGFNQFGLNYGTQEFFVVNIPNLNEQSPFRTIFFADSKNNFFSGQPSICKTRENLKPSPYDINYGKKYFFCFDNVKESSDFMGLDEDIAAHKDGGYNRLYLNKNINKQGGISYPYISFATDFGAQVGLFGSRLYYAQESNLSKAFLFLHSFPWNGLITSENNGLFGPNEIKNTFSNRGGFISAPNLWVAFIGGLLWRLDTSQPIMDKNQQIGGGSGNIDPLIFGKFNGSVFESYVPTINNRFPSRYQYVHSSSSYKSSLSFSDSGYLALDTILLQLPDQVKNEFKKVFFNFVGTSNSKSPWETIKNKLEIFKGNDAAWVSTWNSISTNTSATEKLFKEDDFLWFDKYKQTIDSNLFKQKYNATYDGNLALDNYFMVTRCIDDKFKYNYFTELKDSHDAVFNLLRLINEETIISNNTYKIWDTSEIEKNTNKVYGSVAFTKSNLELFANTLLAKIVPDVNTEKEKEKQNKQSIFGTDNENLIKFQLYRTCKNIYDKWIGDTSSVENLIFRSGINSRNGLDLQLAKNRALTKNGDPTPSLIDSFRFVTRSFRDIGDEMYVNPKDLVQSITTNPGASFYNVITNLLTANQFNFIALPNYINYNNPSELETMFQPVTTIDSFSSGSTGPAFVCVYVGQPSKYLDFKDSNYRHDGIDFQCNNGNLIEPNVKDFFNEKKDYENNVAVFSVNYSQQNQNIFKDISLDQNEFTETNESLQVIDEIAKKGAENRTTLGGQNLYDVYSVRSYKAEVEMMGNAMIQPMMYFQLNNIPMFHGAYLITHVKHAIKPNHMSTNFTGVRVRNVETPMLDAASLYMPLLDSVLGSENSTSSSSNRISSTVDISFAANCGDFIIKKPIVDGASGYADTKPIRDLVAVVESGGNYNAYNNGVAGVKGNTNYSPVTMTISQIKLAQAKEGSDRIFAVGKYQLIPDTFKNMVKTLGFSDNDIFNADRQEQAGEWLILKGAGYRKGLRAYFGESSVGDEKSLQAAITDLALEFASFPTYFGTNRTQAVNRLNPLGYNQNTALYGGSAGNPAKAKFCAQDVAKALIQTWKNRNPRKTPVFDYSKITAVSNQGR